MPVRLFAVLLFGLAACTDTPPDSLPEAVPVAVAADTLDRRVAVTFDDLPAVALPSGMHCDRAALDAFTDTLLAEIGEVPTTGFVVEGHGCDDEGLLPGLLTAWLDAGHELGNHTASHPDLNDLTVAEYTADIVRGETVTKPLVEARGQRLRYFRYPYLHAGDTAEKKAAVEAFLAERGYTNAPVTLDNDEWIFARAYALAAERGDAELKQRIGAAYVDFMEAVTVHFEGWSVEVLGYEPPQVLLVHANLLNADTFGEVAAMLARRGYRFVSLEEALEDPAYARPDPYVGPYGISWLHRWALDEGLERRWEPDAPEWVTAIYEEG
ncbi:MAG: polysaccharide deacetylase family protein [Rhodothermales bacterium]